LLILELTTPDHAIPWLQVNVAANFLPCLSNEASKVPVDKVALDCNAPHVVLTADP
jgi:hypothetical protein